MERSHSAESTLAVLAPVSPLSADEAPINILLVDDEPKNLAVLEAVLDDPRYRLVRAESGDEALLALIVEDFAVIILDIQMPGMTGFELALLIKQRRKTADIPIIFLTAYYGEEQNVLEGYQTGAVDYLHKPVNSAILRSKVAVFADLYRKTRENAYANAALLAEVTERRRIQDQVQTLNDELEKRVAARTDELMAANAALSTSEERLRLAQQAGRVGVWEWDLRTGEGTWTAAAWAVCDPVGPATGITFEKWLSQIHPDDRQRAQLAIEQAKTSGRYQDEYRTIGAGSPSKWVESVGAVEFADGIPVKMRGAIRDITERKVIELQLKEANRRKDEFLAMLGHELRNPLAPIRNAISVLQKSGAADATLSACRDVIDRQTQQLTRLVDDLLDVSRVSSGKIKLQKAIVDVESVITQAIETTRALIDSRSHQLVVTLPTIPLHVEGDAFRLAQVVANLLNNAAKYTNAGGTISLIAETESDPGSVEWVTIKVRDTGRGFDMTSADQLFDLFFQSERDLSRSEGGLGVGLSLVRSLVQMHGGSVQASSPGHGQGSEFVVRLPRCPVPRNEAPAAPPVGVATDQNTVLIVDDNRDSADTMATLLRLLGHKALVAYDGQQAVQLATDERPHVVFLDIGLPRMNGHEVCRSMRDSGLSSAFIVAMTGYGQDEDYRRSREAGFDLHLVKPVGLSEVQKALAENLSRHK